jgi:hypothetical protein
MYFYFVPIQIPSVRVSLYICDQLNNFFWEIKIKKKEN